MSGPIELYRDLLRETPADAEHASVDRACAEDARAARARRSSPTAGRRRCGPNFRRCVLEPRESQDLPLHRRGADAAACSPAEAGAHGAVDRYHLCFALGKALEDRGEFAESFALLRARQCAEARREPLPPRDHRDQHAPADRGLHRRVLRAAARGWGCAEIPIRSSSSACRARARRCSSRSWPRTRRSRARRNSPTSSRSSTSCTAASRIRTIRATRACSQT